MVQLVSALLMMAQASGPDRREELFEAIRQGDAKRVAGLLKAQPELAQARNQEGAGIVLWAVYTRRPDLAERLLAGRTADLFEASALGKTGQVRAILAREPAAVSHFSADGFTPLGLAVFFGHRETARMLLEAGADVNAPSRNAIRVAPLHSAVAAGDLEAVRLLLARGAAVDPVEFLGATPLHAAAMLGRADIAQVLLDAGADPNRKTKEGKTALDLAAANGHTDVIELLRGR